MAKRRRRNQCGDAAQMIPVEGLAGIIIAGDEILGVPEIGSAPNRRRAPNRKRANAKRTRLGVRNVEMGFKDSHGVFHPIRASSDYDQDRVGQVRRPAKKKRAKPKRRR